MIALVCLAATITLCGVAVASAADPDLSALRSRSFAAAPIPDVDLSQMYASRPFATAAIDVDLTAMRKRPPVQAAPPKPTANQTAPSLATVFPAWHQAGTTYWWSDGVYRPTPQAGLNYSPPPKPRCVGNQCFVN